MSLEFNRRSFLKYSAAAAVAVAGSSLLVGCGEDEYQKTGKIGSTLKLMGTFKTYKSADDPDKAPTYDSNTSKFTCTVNIKCTTITDPEFDLEESEDAKDFALTITSVDIQDGDTVELKYWPRIQASSGNSGYTRAFCTWKMVAKKDTNSNKIVLE